MPKKKPPPMVRMEQVFVRDAQRRLRLVIELLEQEALRQPSPAPVALSTEPPRALAAQTSSGGTK